MKKIKLEEISFIKTLMMIVVVLYHSCIFFSGNWFNCIKPVYNAPKIYLIAKWLNTFHIYTFVMASGFLFFYLKIEKGRYNSIKKDIFKKGKRLLLPYFFTSLFWVIPISTYFFEYDFENIFKKFILCIEPSQLWFIIMLFVVFVVFEILFKYIRIDNMYLILFYIISVFLNGALGYFDINCFQIASASKFIMFFYLGGYLYKYKYKLNFEKGIILFIIGLVLGLLLLKFDNDILLYKILKLFLEQLFSVVEVVLIYMLGNYIISKNNFLINSSFYKLFEKNSFGIYLFHQQIIYFCIVLLNGLVNPIIQVILSFIISLSISLLMSMLLQKNKITKTMFGL